MLYIDIDSIECKFTSWKKWQKLSEDYLKTETMAKAPVKFQKSQRKMVVVL